MFMCFADFVNFILFIISCRYLCQVMPLDCGFVECFKQLLTDEEESKMADLVRTEVPFVKNKNMTTKETGMLIQF